MSQKQTMRINGREYDLITGLPVDNLVTKAKISKAVPQTNTKSTHKKANSSYSVHKKVQRSTTLNRHFVKKSSTSKILKPEPAVKNKSPEPIKPVAPKVQQNSRKRIDGIRPTSYQGSTMRSNINLARSIKKHRVNIEPTNSTPIIAITPTTKDEAPMAHPILERVNQKQSQKNATVQQEQTLTASLIKQAAINDAINNAPKHHAKQHKQKNQHGKLFSIISAFAALMLFAGYLTYLNVPNLSVRVAAAQAGIDASYPGYRPDGYKLNGPVAFSDGEVRMQFVASTGDNNFTLKESRSSWDSNALLENYVKEKSDNNYITSQEKGITVYSFSGNAAWVSGGILYTIDGNAQLSPDQVRKIATSV